MVSIITMKKYKECDGGAYGWYGRKIQRMHLEELVVDVNSFKIDVIELWVYNIGFLWIRTGRLHVTISFQDASGNPSSINMKEITWVGKKNGDLWELRF